MFDFLKTRRARRLLEDRQDRAESILMEEDKGSILNRLPDDAARYKACMRWAEEARDTYYRERRETIAQVITSQEPRYKQYSPLARQKIGDARWSRSVRSKDLVALEQMYTRWASAYKSGPESR